MLIIFKVRTLFWLVSWCFCLLWENNLICGATEICALPLDTTCFPFLSLCCKRVADRCKVRRCCLVYEWGRVRLAEKGWERWLVFVLARVWLKMWNSRGDRAAGYYMELSVPVTVMGLANKQWGGWTLWWHSGSVAENVESTCCQGSRNITWHLTCHVIAVNVFSQWSLRWVVFVAARVVENVELTWWQDSRDITWHLTCHVITLLANEHWDGWFSWRLLCGWKCGIDVVAGW